MTNERAIDRIRQAFIEHGLTVRDKGPDKFRAQAPGHSAADDSVVFWQIGDHVAMCTYADEDKKEVLDAVGLTAADLYDNPKGRSWEYPDDRRVTRKPLLNSAKMKTFVQENAKGKTSLLRVTFPADETVYVVEGEGKVDALEAIGAAATCSAGGGNSARNADWSPLQGHPVVIVLDDDKTGETYGKTIAEQLDKLNISYQIAKCAPHCHDITDHLAADHGLDDLQIVGEAEARPRIWKATELHAAAQPQWLAKGRLPRAAVSLLVGDEGIGKSLLWVWIAAAVTRGRALPEFGIPARTPGRVLIVCTEDEWSPTVLPRLLVADADLDLVSVICTDPDGSGSPVFPRDLYLVEGNEHVLVVIDSWLDTVPASLSVKDPQQARQALHPWKEVATRTGAAVLLLTHTNRVSTGNARDKYGITSELRKKARLTLFAQQDDEGNLVVGPEKANTTGAVPASKFTIEPVQHFPPTDDDDGTVGLLKYIGDSERTAREHIVDSHDGDDSSGSRTEAEAWLYDYLTEHQWVASADAKKDGAKALRVSEKTIQRASKSLRVISESRGFPRTTHWSLPDVAAGVEDQVAKWAADSQDSQDTSQDTDPPISLQGVPTVPTGDDQPKHIVPTGQSGQSGHAPSNGAMACPHCSEPLEYDDDRRDGYHSSRTKCVQAHRKSVA